MLDYQTLFSRLLPLSSEPVVRTRNKSTRPWSEADLGLQMVRDHLLGVCRTVHEYAQMAALGQKGRKGAVAQVAEKLGLRIASGPRGHGAKWVEIPMEVPTKVPIEMVAEVPTAYDRNQLKKGHLGSTTKRKVPTRVPIGDGPKVPTQNEPKVPMEIPIEVPTGSSRVPTEVPTQERVKGNKLSALHGSRSQKVPMEVPTEPSKVSTRALSVLKQDKYINYLFSCMHACLKQKAYEFTWEELASWIENFGGDPMHVAGTWNNLRLTNIDGEIPRPVGLIRKAMTNPGASWIFGTTRSRHEDMGWMDLLLHPNDWAKQD